MDTRHERVNKLAGIRLILEARFGKDPLLQAGHYLIKDGANNYFSGWVGSSFNVFVTCFEQNVAA